VAKKKKQATPGKLGEALGMNVDRDRGVRGSIARKKNGKKQK